MEPLIKEPVTICRLPAETRIYFGHPSVLALPGGRILVSVDALGPDVRDLPGQKNRFADTNHWLQGRLFTSPDGQSWAQKLEYPFSNGCLFRDGNTLYLLGHRGALMIMRSADGGETWSKPAELAPKGGDAAVYSHSPCSVLHANGHFSVALLRATGDYHRRIAPHTLAPVLLRAPEGFNLAVSKSWTWSAPGPTYAQAVRPDDASPPPAGAGGSAPRGENSGREEPETAPGWTYPHALALADPRHVWHDASGKTTHLLCALSPDSGAAVLAAFCDQADGIPRAELHPVVPDSRPMPIPIPGGNRRFHVFADAESRHYWLLSTQMRGRLLRPERPTSGRSDRLVAHPHLLQLSFSNNLVDWTLAGWVAGSPLDPLTDPTMDVRGRDLCIAACARDPDDPSQRHAKRLVFGIVRDFRNLLYGAA